MLLLLPNKSLWSCSCLYYLQYCRRDVNDIGQVNVAFSRTDSSIDVTFKSVQSLNDEEQVNGDDEDDCITPQDMMSFSWQIAQGMVSEERFILFNCTVRVISCSTCLNAAKCSINYSKLPSSLGRLDGPHSVLFLRDHACLNRIALIVLLRVLLPTAVLLFSRIDNCTIIVQSSGSELYLRISFPVTVDPKSSMIFLVLAILISKRYCSSGSRSS